MTPPVRDPKQGIGGEARRGQEGEAHERPTDRPTDRLEGEMRLNQKVFMRKQMRPTILRARDDSKCENSLYELL